MKTKFKKILGVMGAVAVGTLVAVDPALAAAPTDSQGLGVIAANMKSTASSATDILSIVSYVIGVAFGIKGALKFKESNETKGQVPISQPITLLAVAALLLALPSLLEIARDAVMGTGTSNTSLSTGSSNALRTVK